MYTGNEEADSNSNRNYSCRQIALADSVQFKHYNACTQTAIRFLQGNTKFYNCSQTAIHYFTAKYEILQLYPNGHSYFPQGNTKCNYLS